MKQEAFSARIGRRAFVVALMGTAAAVALPDGAFAQGWFSSNKKGNWQNSGKQEAPTQTEVINDLRVRPMLTTQSEFFMQDAIARYEIIVARGGWPAVPGGKALVLDSKSKAVPILRERLRAEGYLPEGQVEDDKIYDEYVEEGVRRFQLAHGLYANGRLDNGTTNALNVPAAARLDQLRANLPRVVEYSKNLGRRYIVVNIPAAQLDAVENGQLRSRHNIVVGKIDRPSPVVISQVSDINFNPYWNAPASIVQRDIIPQMMKDPQILQKMQIRVYDGVGGPEIDPSTVDWRNTPPERYHFRQEPGDGNAMASVKINFSNPYAVYMHDTPTKQLFTEASRYFSSGCVRVDKVHILTNWILNGQEGWNTDRIEQMVASKERLDVKVMDPPQVRFAYLTAWVADDGTAFFRPDIYHLDGTGFVTGQPEPRPEAIANNSAG
ncbi:MAG: murein L,D-transpeptidase [Parvibaculaceae bacterium]